MKTSKFPIPSSFSLDQAEKDPSKQSFIVSLTQGDKFTLQTDKGIYNKQDLGLFFGYKEG
jgi:hypothetical protein